MRTAVAVKLPSPAKPTSTKSSRCDLMSVRRLQTYDALSALTSELACADEDVDIDDPQENPFHDDLSALPMIVNGMIKRTREAQDGVPGHVSSAHHLFPCARRPLPPP